MSRSFKKVLVLAPHTDDGELGAGGFISRLIDEGSEVHYVAFSNAIESLPSGLPADTLQIEMLAATAILGLDANNVSLRDYPVRRLNYHRQDILDDMIKLRNALSPDLVLLPSSADIHQDHQVVSAEGRRAFKNTTVLGYELVWNISEFTNNFYVSLTAEHLSRKCDSVAAYKSQGRRTYVEPGFITSLARVRGVQGNTEFAESFEAIRVFY